MPPALALRRRLRRLHDRRGRQRRGRILLEGERVVVLARQQGMLLEDLVVLESRQDLLLKFPEACPASAEELAELCTTTSPAPAVAATTMPDLLQVDDLDLRRGLLALDGVQDPGNLGSLIRTAEALGLGGVVLSRGCVDPWSPKVVRGSMGACLTTALIAGPPLEESLRLLAGRGVALLAGVAEGGQPPGEIGDPGPWCLVLGSEAHGISIEVQQLPLRSLTLRIGGSVGSLGVAAAGAILMHLLRQGESDRARCR